MRKKSLPLLLCVIGLSGAAGMLLLTSPGRPTTDAQGQLLTVSELREWVGGATLSGYTCTKQECGTADEANCDHSNSDCNDENIGAYCRTWKDYTKRKVCEQASCNDSCNHDGAKYCYTEKKCKCSAVNNCAFDYSGNSGEEVQYVCGTW